MTGIYKITNLVNSKVYIGSSAISIKRRWDKHTSALKKGNHHSVKLQRAWNKYGKENFVLEILEECIPEKCIAKEQHWLDLYQSAKIGYNINHLAQSRLGVKQIDKSKCKGRGKWSAESKLKLSISRTGLKSPKTSLAMKGKSTKKIPIEQWKDGKFIKDWASATDVTKALGIVNLQEALKGKRKSAGGFQWQYKTSLI
jgi:group I intron endonuclease